MTISSSLSFDRYRSSFIVLFLLPFDHRERKNYAPQERARGRSGPIFSEGSLFSCLQRLNPNASCSRQFVVSKMRCGEFFLRVTAISYFASIVTISSFVHRSIVIVLVRSCSLSIIVHRSIQRRKKITLHKSEQGVDQDRSFQRGPFFPAYKR